MAEQLITDAESMLAGNSIALAFCKRHGIVDETQTALSLVQETFPCRRGLDLRVESDPDEPGEWLAIEVVDDRDVDQILAVYHRCIRLWAERLSASALKVIRLVYAFD